MLHTLSPLLWPCLCREAQYKLQGGVHRKAKSKVFGQVWFQNNRARHKKSLQQNSGGQASASSLSSSFSPTMSTSAMYVSASEEGDSVQDNDLNVFPGDVDQPEDGSGHNDFAPQSFW